MKQLGNSIHPPLLGNRLRRQAEGISHVAAHSSLCCVVPQRPALSVSRQHWVPAPKASHMPRLAPKPRIWPSWLPHDWGCTNTWQVAGPHPDPRGHLITCPALRMACHHVGHAWCQEACLHPLCPRAGCRATGKPQQWQVLPPVPDSRWTCWVTLPGSPHWARQGGRHGEG